MTDDTERRSELLIDIGHEQAVLDKLAEVSDGVFVTGRDDDHRLGLTRLSLTRVALGNVAGGLNEATVSAAADPMGFLTDLLRDWARTLPTPFTVDRTRETDQVSSMPHVKGNPTSLAPGQGAVVAVGEDLTPLRPVAPRVGIADAQPFAHRELVGRFVGDPFPDPSPDPFTTELPGHATFVVGTVLRRAPAAVPVCRTVLTPKVNDADQPNSVWAVSRRLVGFLDDDVDVVNMSFACRTGGQTTPPLPLQRAVEALARRGIVLVAAGGNEGTTAEDPPWPAAFDQVVAVGATGSGLPELSYLDLLAPGENVPGPFLQGSVQLPGSPVQEHFATGYVTWGGSSFAAAYVTGEIARLMASEPITAAMAVERLRGGVDLVTPARAS